MKIEGSVATWSVRAEKTGPHNLILRFSELFYLPDARLEVVAGDRHEIFRAAEEELVLPLLVTTEFRVKDTTAMVIRWGVLLVGFIFTLPFLKEFFKKALVEVLRKRKQRT